MINLFIILIVLLIGYFVFNMNNTAEKYTDILKEQNNDEKTANKYSYNSNQRESNENEWMKDMENSGSIFDNQKSEEKVVPLETQNNDLNGEVNYNEEEKVNESDPQVLYNVDNYLPQETNDDWFDTVKEPIPIEKRNLISQVRPIGLDTIGSSKKNCTRDIRGEYPNAKLAVSPWNNSSIEPSLQKVLF